MKKYLESYLFLFSIAGFIIVADQWTKFLVRSNLAIGESWTPLAWLPILRIYNWKNTGAAFGMLQDFNLVFSILAVIISIAIIFYFPRVEKRDWPLRVALSMQMGGALGNFIDRLTQGYVTDFVSVGRFAIFNVADASISVGVAVLILGVWLRDRHEAKKNRTSSGKQPAESEPGEPAPDKEQPPVG